VVSSPGEFPAGLDHVDWKRRRFQVALALAAFALPLLLLPLVPDLGTGVWVRAGLEGSTVRQLWQGAEEPYTRYVLLANGGVYRSEGDGADWDAANNGLPTDRWGRVMASSLTADPSQPAAAFVAGRWTDADAEAATASLYWTDDSGETWLALASAPPGRQLQALTTVRAAGVGVADLYVATDEGLFLSGDRGRTWERLGWRGVDTTILSITADRAVPGMLFVGTRGAGLYRSRDGGMTWSLAVGEVDGLDIYGIATVSGVELCVLATSRGVYRCTDQSAGWERTGGVLNNAVALAIAAHPQAANVFCAGLLGGGVWCSVDGGQDWAPLQTGMGRCSVHALAFDSNDPQTLWAGTTDGVWRYRFARDGAFAVIGRLPEATSTPTATLTPTSVPTATFTPTGLPTPTTRRSSTATITQTLTPTATLMPTPMPTDTPLPTPTHTEPTTLTPTQEPTQVSQPPTVQPTATETATPTTAPPTPTPTLALR